MAQCRHCKQAFTRTWALKAFCGEACKQEHRRRVCQWPGCRKVFQAKNDVSPRPYCGEACRLKALEARRAETTKAAAVARVARGRTEVVCGWEDCPKPEVLISVRVSEVAAGEKKYHRDGCLQAWNEAGRGLRGMGKGRVLSCQSCGQEIGYRSPSQVNQKYCLACGLKAGGIAGGIAGGHSHATHKKQGEDRPCSVCGTLRYFLRSELKKHEHEGSPFYCSRDCWHADRRGERFGKKVVRCTCCGQERAYYKHRLPRRVDRATMTWLCPKCRVPVTGYQQRTCEHCGIGFRARIRVAKPEASRFHSLACRTAHYMEARRRRGPCAQCGGPIKRRGQASKYCSWECTKASKQGRPNPHWRPSRAEQRVLEQWTAGVRGVRPLARAARVADTTVRNMKAAGKLVESAAAARSA